MQVMLTFGPDADDWPVIEREWPADVDLVLPRPTTASSEPESDECPARYVDDVAEVSVIVGPMRGATLETFRQAVRLKMVHTLGHGVDALQTGAVRDLLVERGVVVARANNAAIPISEFVLMNMIALSRRVMGMHSSLTQRGDWSPELKAQRASGVLGGELFGKTLGLVGYGAIGVEIHRRAKALGMTVGAYVRRPRADADLDFQSRDLSDFLPRCDYVVLCLPLTPDTRHMIDARRIDLMKDGAYLVNISRGALVDESALHDALRSGKLAGAGLDVWEVEERGVMRGYPSPHPLHDLNVIMTPHYSGATREGRARALYAIGRNLQRLLAGDPIENVVPLTDTSKSP